MCVTDRGEKIVIFYFLQFRGVGGGRRKTARRVGRAQNHSRTHTRLTAAVRDEHLYWLNDGHSKNGIVQYVKLTSREVWL